MQYIACNIIQFNIKNIYNYNIIYCNIIYFKYKKYINVVLSKYKKSIFNINNNF